MQINLEKLQRGAINPGENCRPKNPLYSQHCKQFDIYREDLEKMLRPEQLVILENMMNENISTNYYHSQQMYIDGFKLGIQIIIECIND